MKQSEKSHQLSLGERVLLLLSRPPSADDYSVGHDKWTREDALSQLCDCFPNFLNKVIGKDVLDFGCGTGYQSVALARLGAKSVVGFDTSTESLRHARQLAQAGSFSESVRFVKKFTSDLQGRFDVVISQNSMEHFPDPEGALTTMKSALNCEGMIFLTFGPPWLAPSGSHMQFFVRVPWVNILFSEATVMSVRSRFRNDGATRYEQVEGGLNRMTLRKFERLMGTCSLTRSYERYDCVKQLNFLSKVPVIRELAVNRISCILTP